MNLADVLERVTGTVSYLRAACEAPTDDGWIPAVDLRRDHDLLGALITSTGRGRGTDDPQVAASLFAQAYAFRVAGVALAAYALGLPVPDTTPAAVAIRIDRHRPAALALLSTELTDPDPVAVATAVLDGHLAPFLDAVRDRVRVGERLLWGNVATSCAVAFRAVESATDPSVAAVVRRRAEAWFAAAPHLDGLGGFSTLTQGNREGWYWDRTNCCLWYQASGGRLCDDCSLEPVGDRLARRRRELAETAP